MKRLPTLCAVLVITAGGLAACGEDEPEPDTYQAVCVDPTTQQRIDDDYCDPEDDDYRGFMPLFIPLGYGTTYVPPVGKPVTGAVAKTAVPKTARFNTRPAPSKGGYGSAGSSVPSFGSKPQPSARNRWVEPARPGSKPDTVNRQRQQAPRPAAPRSKVGR